MLSAAALLSCSLGSYAAPVDNWQFSVGTYLWLQDFQGKSTYVTAPLDQEAILGYDESDESGLVYQLGIEHSHLPWLPQLRIQHSDIRLQHEETTTTTSGMIVPITTTVTTQANTDLSHTDVIFFYPFKRSVFHLDLGLVSRTLEGEIRATDGTNDGMVEISETAPLLFGAGTIKIDLDEENTYFFAGGEAMGLEYGDISHLDYKVSIGVHTPVGIRFESGARKFDLDYNGDDDSANVSVKGFFAGVSYHF
jgi:outer membrane protein